MMDYEIKNGRWMRPIRASGAENARAQAVGMLRDERLVAGEMWKHYRHGYPRKMGTLAVNGRYVSIRRK